MAPDLVKLREDWEYAVRVGLHNEYSLPTAAEGVWLLDRIEEAREFAEFVETAARSSNRRERARVWLASVKETT